MQLAHLELAQLGDTVRDFVLKLEDLLTSFQLHLTTNCPLLQMKTRLLLRISWTPHKKVWSLDQSCLPYLLLPVLVHMTLHLRMNLITHQNHPSHLHQRTPRPRQLGWRGVNLIWE
jgi:hypothetical protein